VSNKEISISPSKLEAIKRMAQSSGKKSLQRLIGLAQYFRRYIPNFSAKIANMRKLLKKDKKFVWTENCQRGLEELNKLLLEAPILRSIRNDRPIYLYIDASATGIGGAVLQYGDTDKSPHVCAYISFATTETQRRWSPYQLEFLALGLCLKQHETVFLQYDLTVDTDNAVVAAIQTYKPINNRERRLIAFITQFPMTLRYLPGRKNTIADCLSRNGEDLKKEDLVKCVPPQKLYDEEFILPVNQMEDRNWTVYSLQDVPTGATDVNPLRRSSRIAERRAKLEKLTKSIKDSVTNRPDEIDEDPAPNDLKGSASELISKSVFEPVSEPISKSVFESASETTFTPAPTSISTAPSLEKTTNEIFDDLRNTDSLPDQVNVQETAKKIQNMIDMPIITEVDYTNDEFFQPIYQYLKEEKVTGNKKLQKNAVVSRELFYRKQPVI